MKASGSSSSFWDWAYIVGGTAMVLIVLSKALTSFATGLLQFSSSKYGFVFSGIEAAVIYGALLIGSVLVIGIGWRGLRHGRQDT